MYLYGKTFKKHSIYLLKRGILNAMKILCIFIRHFYINNLTHKKFCILIEYILFLPSTNAPVNRVFSLMNKLSTSAKPSYNFRQCR